MAKRRSDLQPKSPKPDAEYVMSLYQLRLNEGDEARLRTLAANFRLLTRMEHKLKIPKAYKAIAKEVRTPYVRDAWLRITAALTQKPPSIHIEPGDDTVPAKRATGIAERWDMAAMDELNRTLRQNVLFDSAKAIIRDGESVLKTSHRPHAWANFPRRERGESADAFMHKVMRYKRKSPLPFAWRVVDRLQMLFGDGEYGDDWCLEYGEYPTPYLGRRYGMEVAVVDGQPRLVHPQYLLGGRPKPEGELTTAIGRSVKVEYWDADWWHVVIDGSDAPGFPQPNPYSPRLPYHRAMSADSEPLLYSLLFLVPALDELLTMKLNWGTIGAYPTPILKAVPNVFTGQLPQGDDASPPNVRWAMGKEISLPPGWEYAFLVPPPVGGDLNQLIGLLTALIDIAGVPSVFRGVGGADQAGYAINQLMAAASLAFKMASENLQAQFESAFEFFHWLIPNHIHQEVFVLGAGGSDDEGGKAWLGLKPDGEPSTTVAPVSLLGPVKVELKPVLPTDEQARAMLAQSLSEGDDPLISKRYAREHYLQVEDPEQMQDEIWVEKAMNAPEVNALLVERALKNAGLLPAASAAPQPTILGPNGQPISSAMAGVPGAPSVPGLTMPFQPPPPQPPGGMTGRPAGSFPGSPPRQAGNIPVVEGG